MEACDILLIGGRCIDPETGLDGVRNVGIGSDGSIQFVCDVATPLPPAGTMIDCAGLVVAPGFIDLHSHGAAHPPTARLQALDGCTFHGEFEFGADDVSVTASSPIPQTAGASTSFSIGLPLHGRWRHGLLRGRAGS